MTNLLVHFDRIKVPGAENHWYIPVVSHPSHKCARNLGWSLGVGIHKFPSTAGCVVMQDTLYGNAFEDISI